MTFIVLIVRFTSNQGHLTTEGSNEDALDYFDKRKMGLERSKRIMRPALDYEITHESHLFVSSR